MDFADIIIIQDLGGSAAELLITITEKIKEERKKLQEGHDSGLEFLLSGVVKRDHLSLESTLESKARDRDVEVSGQVRIFRRDTNIIDSFGTSIF